MRARIATVAAIVAMVLWAAPAADAAACSIIEQILGQCQENSEPTPTPEPTPEPSPEPAPQPEVQANPGHRAAAADRILVLMNNERAERGLPRLAVRADASAISAPHSEAMAAKGTIWHNDAYFTDQVKKRLDARLLGENVARNTDIDDAHSRLMNSPGHRANILDARFTVVGLAVYDDGWGNLYVTQNFVQPNPPAAPAPPATPKPSAAAAAPVASEKPRSAAPTTQPPAPTTTAAPVVVPEPTPTPEPAVLAAGPDAAIAPVDAAQAPAPAGPNPVLLGIVALLALGSIAAYAFRTKLHFLVQVADR